MKRSTRIVLLGSDGVTAQRSAAPNGGFLFENIRPGTYLLHVQPQGAGGRLQQLRVQADRETFAGSVLNSCDEPENGLCDRMVVGEPRQAEPVYTVCEALAMRDALAHSPVVIVGILAQRPTLALSQTCKQTLITGDFTWPNSIAFETGLSMPAKALHLEIDRKVQDLIAGEPGEKRVRRRDVVAFSGRFLAPAGIVDCKQRSGCGAIRSVAARPAVLSSLNESDIQLFR